MYNLVVAVVFLVVVFFFFFFFFLVFLVFLVFLFCFCVGLLVSKQADLDIKQDKAASLMGDNSSHLLILLGYLPPSRKKAIIRSLPVADRFGRY